MPLECRVERCSGGRGLDEVLGTYIFHCPCQPLYCFLSLVSQRWCFLKLPLVEGDTAQPSSRLKFLAFQLFPTLNGSQASFPCLGGKGGCLVRKQDWPERCLEGTACAVTRPPRGCCVYFGLCWLSHAAGDEQHFAKPHWYRAGLTSLSNPQPEGKY